MNAAGYNFLQAGNDFEFYTAFGTAYAVSFVQASGYFDNKHPVKNFIFRIDIEQTDPGPYNHPDFRVGITIAEIIYSFFEADNQNVIFYICDPQDGRMIARQRKFDYWYRLFNDGNSNRIIAAISTKDFTIEANFIFKKDNVFAYDLPVIIENAKDNLSNK